ncbi:MAG: DUF3987 domain-containing protein [Limisphaerales bacterium]
MNSSFWKNCVSAVDEKLVRFVAEWRCWSVEFVWWCVKQNYIGALDGGVAFPVRDVHGEVVGAHVRSVALDGSWRYSPTGLQLVPTVYGTPGAAKLGVVFESTWDALTCLYALGSHKAEGRELLNSLFFIVTRGSQQGATVRQVLPPGEYRLAAVMQRDEPRPDGKPTPAEKWLADANNALGVTLNAAYPPVGVKDINEWLRSGAPLELEAIWKALAEAVRPCKVVHSSIPVDLTAPRPVLQQQATELGDDSVVDFPVELLPPVLNAWVKEVVRVEQVDPALPAMVALGIVSAALGKNPRAKLVGSYVSSANLFLMAIAQSGGRKTSVMNRGAKALRKIEAELLAEWQKQTKPRLLGQIQALELSRDELRKKLGGTKALPSEARKTRLEELAVREAELREQLKHEPRLSVEDITPERLGMLLDNAIGTASLLSSEPGDAIATLKGRYRKSGESSDTLLLKGWSLEPCSIDRVGRDTVLLREPCLTLTWLVQPCRFETLLDGDAAIRGGFLPRLLLARIPIAPMSPPSTTVDEILMSNFDGLIESLLRRFRLEQGTTEIPVSIAAREVLEEFRLDRAQAVRSAPGELGALAARHAEHACRLAIVVHCARFGDKAGESAIDEGCARAAIAFTRWFVEQQDAILRNQVELAEVSEVEKVRTWFVLHPGIYVTVRQLTRCGVLHHGDTVLAKLVAEGFLMQQEIKTGGRPKIVFSLAPSVV